jgi:hypothetical protein
MSIGIISKHKNPRVKLVSLFYLIENEIVANGFDSEGSM